MMEIKYEHKCKMIRADSAKMEQAVNNWMNENDNVEIVSTQMVTDEAASTMVIFFKVKIEIEEEPQEKIEEPVTLPLPGDKLAAFISKEYHMECDTESAIGVAIEKLNGYLYPPKSSETQEGDEVV